MTNGQKTLINNSDYVFNPVARTITLTDSYDLEQILVITNTTDQIMIYSSFDTTLGGTISGNVLTLEYNTTSMSADDSLQIWVWDYDAVSLVDLVPALKILLQAIANPSYVDKTANQLRAQVTGTISTVTTCTTVTGLTNIDGYQGKTLLINQAMSAWANACRSRIS